RFWTWAPPSGTHRRLPRRHSRVFPGSYHGPPPLDLAGGYRPRHVRRHEPRPPSLARRKVEKFLIGLKIVQASIRYSNPKPSKSSKGEIVLWLFLKFEC